MTEPVTTPNLYRKRNSSGRISLQNIQAVLQHSEANARPSLAFDETVSPPSLAKVPLDLIALDNIYKGDENTKEPTAASVFNADQINKYYAKDPEPMCKCGAGAEDISYRHDAFNLSNCQPANDKRKNRLSSVITVDYPENVKFSDVSLIFDPTSQLPPNSRIHLENLRKDLRRIQKEWKFEQRVGEVADPEDVERLIKEIYNEKVISNAVFYDVARQAAGECEPRGDLLDSIRKKYNALVNEIPEPLKCIAEDLFDQRNLDKDMAKSLLDFQTWWRQQSLPLEENRQQSTTLYQNLEKDIEFLTTSLPKLDSENYQLKSMITLHAAYRARSEQNLQELVLAREEWQDLAYAICAKGIKDQRLVKLTEMHVLHQMWYVAAKQRYKDLHVLDENELSQIRTLEKEFLGTLRALEAKLLEQETETVQLVQILRTDVDKKLHHSLFRNYRQTGVLDSFPAWLQLLNEISGHFSYEKETEYAVYFQRLESLFENIVQRTLRLYIKFRNREESITSDTPKSHLRKSLRETVLFTHLDPNYRKMSPIDTDFGAFVANPTESPLYYSNPASPLMEPDALLSGPEFTESLKIFGDLLAGHHSSRSASNFRHDLSAFPKSKPYADLYRLWQMFSNVKQHFIDRMRGNQSFRNWIGEMSGSMDKLKADIPDELTFTVAIGGLLDRTHDMLNLMKNDYSSMSAPKSHNIIKRFASATAAWLLFSQSALNAATVSILERISVLFVEMVRCGSELMVMLFPNRNNEKQAFNNVNLMHGRIDILVEDLQRISTVLDGISLPPVRDEEYSELENTLCASFVSEVVEKWRIYSALCVNFAYEIVSKELITFLPMSRLAVYDKATLREDLAYGDSAAEYDKMFDNVINVPPCLHGVIRDYWTKEDKIKVSCVGEDENVYVKPFRLMTSTNTRRVLSSKVMGEFSSLLKELTSEKARTVKLTVQLMNLEKELTDINVTNQNLDIDVLYHQARVHETAPPAVTMPMARLADLEELMYREGILPPLLCLTKEDEEPLKAMQPWEFTVNKQFYISDTVIPFL